jgi:hypothetical protein
LSICYRTGSTSNDGAHEADTTRSHGPGILHEAFTHLFQGYLNPISRYFTPKAGDFLSLAPGPFQLHPGFGSPARGRDFKILGAAVLAYLYTMGSIPINLSPILLQLITHQLDVQSLTRDLISSIVPEIYREVIQWRGIGPDASIDHPVWIQRFISSFPNLLVRPLFLFLSPDDL